MATPIIETLYKRFSSEVSFKILTSKIDKDKYDCSLFFKDKLYKKIAGNYLEFKIAILVSDENEIISFCQKVSAIRKLQVVNKQTPIEETIFVKKILELIEVKE